MPPLRQQMIDAMQLRGLSVRTHKSYLAAVYDFARYYYRSLNRMLSIGTPQKAFKAAKRDSGIHSL